MFHEFIYDLSYMNSHEFICFMNSYMNLGVPRFQMDSEERVQWVPWSWLAHHRAWRSYQGVKDCGQQPVRACSVNLTEHHCSWQEQEQWCSVRLTETSCSLCPSASVQQQNKYVPALAPVIADPTLHKCLCSTNLSAESAPGNSRLVKAARLIQVIGRALCSEFQSGLAQSQPGKRRYL